MLACQFGLDGLLAFQEPIHGGIEFILVGVLEVEFLGERGVLPVAGGGQLGAGEEKALGDHGRDEIALPRGCGGDEGVEAEATDHFQDRFDMAMGSGAEDAEGLGGRYEGFPLEGALDEFDDVIGQMGEIAEGLMGDGLADTDGTSEQVGDVGLALVHPRGSGHMDGTIS